MQKEPKIQDIASFRKLLDDVQTMEQLKKVFPLLRPFLRLLGADVEQIGQVLSQVDSLAASTREFSSIPDRFNALFTPRGWIAYEMMKQDVAKAAVLLGEAGNLDEAEQLLVEHYDKDTVEWGIKFMNAVAVFRPRIPLALKALDDYVAGRYHACVPVVLALLDGTVNDLGPRGFFSEGVDLRAWDSIAAHDSGLAALSKLLSKSRTKLTTADITIPYRHGIQHGMDLGYDNKMVAAKAWAALFAIREWAIKVERGQVDEPPPKPKKTWRELRTQLRDLAEDKERISAWTPREIQLGNETPVSGKPDEYHDGTPEHLLAMFFAYWGSRNYGGMAQCLAQDERNQINKTAGRLRARYDSKGLQAFEIIELKDEASAVTTAKVKVEYNEEGQQVQRLLEVRLINEGADGNVAARGKPGSSWALYTGYL